MLREWIRNVPVALIEKILADPRARGSYIWQLAGAELDRRCQRGLAA